MYNHHFDRPRVYESYLEVGNDLPDLVVARTDARQTNLATRITRLVPITESMVPIDKEQHLYLPLT